MLKYIKEASAAKVQVQSTSEIREGSRSNVAVIYIGSCVRDSSATMRAALPDPLW